MRKLYQQRVGERAEDFKLNITENIEDFISEDEMESARKCLSFNKAVGLDKLPDNLLKNEVSTVFVCLD